MLTRILRPIQLTRGERALAMAYAGVTAVAAGITIMIMSSLEGENAIPPEPTFYDSWAIVAGALSAGISLFLLRNWMGVPGYKGLAQSILGGLMVAFLAAFLAGTLIAPIQGSVMGPALLLAAFLSQPWLAAAWIAVCVGAHSLLVVWTNERSWSNDSAVSKLSRLSQLNLYGRRTGH